MQHAVFINAIVCILGTVVGAFFAMASVISIANMKHRWVGVLLVAALFVPLAFVVSGLGAWLALRHGSSQTVMAFIALPWVWTAGFVAAMLLALKS